MLLAELEVWHSRPFTPTRRVSLGHLVLPAEPPPGFGGLLLGAVVAGHLTRARPLHCEQAMSGAFDSKGPTDDTNDRTWHAG